MDSITGLWGSLLPRWEDNIPCGADCWHHIYKKNWIIEGFEEKDLIRKYWE